jgi:hypothetical protein
VQCLPPLVLYPTSKINTDATRCSVRVEPGSWRPTPKGDMEVDLATDAASTRDSLVVWRSVTTVIILNPKRVRGGGGGGAAKSAAGVRQVCSLRSLVAAPVGCDGMQHSSGFASVSSGRIVLHDMAGSVLVLVRCSGCYDVLCYTGWHAQRACMCGAHDYAGGMQTVT